MMCLLLGALVSTCVVKLVDTFPLSPVVTGRILIGGGALGLLLAIYGIVKYKKQNK